MQSSPTGEVNETLAKKLQVFKTVLSLLQKWLSEFGEYDNRNGYTIRKYLERTLKKNVSRIRIEYFIPNQAKRIIVEYMTKILFKLAEQKPNEKDSEICILKKAAKILRRNTQEFMKTPVNFSGSMAVKHNENNSPDIYARS